MDDRLRQIANKLVKFERAKDVRPRGIGAKLLPHLFILEIEMRADQPRLRVRLVGTALHQLFGRDLRGHHLEDFIHGPRGAEVIAGFHQVATSHTPLWMRQRVAMTDRAPRFVEGVVVFLSPNRLYGGLVAGEFTASHSRTSLSGSTFESREIATMDLAL